MGVNFPSSPADGQVLNVSPGVSFVASGGRWRPAPLKTALPKNYLINPCMQISQENGNAAGTTNSWYAADGWKMALSFAGVTSSAQRIQSVTPNGAVDRFRITITTGATMGSGSLLGFDYAMEGQRTADLQWGFAKANNVVLRVGIKAPVGTYGLKIGLVDFYNIPIVVTAPQANTDVIYTFVIPGPVTAGYWPIDTNVGFRIGFSIAAGASFLPSVNFTWQNVGTDGCVGQTNGAVTGNVFELFDVGLYADPYKTGVAPPFVVPDYAAEQRRCQRYWYKAFGFGAMIVSATVGARGGMRHPVPMRITPAGSIKGTPKLYDGTATPTITSLATVCNPYAAEFDITAAAGALTPGRAAQMYYQDDNSYIAMNARL